MTPNTLKHRDRNAMSHPDSETLLESEIEFWKATIETCPVTQPLEAIERMHQALALAESRLEKLRAESRTMNYFTSSEH